MQPMAEESAHAVGVAMDAVSRFVRAERPDLPPGYLTIARVGWLHLGVGSAVVHEDADPHPGPVRRSRG